MLDINKYKIISLITVIITKTINRGEKVVAENTTKFSPRFDWNRKISRVFDYIIKHIRYLQRHYI